MDFAGHPGQPRDVVRPESLAERMLLQKVLHDLAIHSTSQEWWRRLSNNSIIGPFGRKCKRGGRQGRQRVRKGGKPVTSPNSTWDSATPAKPGQSAPAAFFPRRTAHLPPSLADRSRLRRKCESPRPAPGEAIH